MAVGSARLMRCSWWCVPSIYGCMQVKNAVHCTDLPEDGGIESRYFFQLLQSA